VVELSRNFGHHKALMTGLDHAKGDLCFLIDSDLEEAPEVLKEFFDALRGQDVDVVYGYQTSRKGNPIESKGGRLAWSLIDYLYSIQIPRNQCTVRLMLREYVDALLRHRESNTVIGGLWVITGFKQVGMPINKGHRGQSSYNLLKRIETLVNGITSFSTAPLLFMLYFGIFVSLVSFLLGLGVLAQKLIYNSASGWASLIVSIWFLDGVIVFGLGLIGLYISRIFVETKNRPYVIVRRIHERKKAG
jgi:putative glycosyltransferase